MYNNLLNTLDGIVQTEGSDGRNYAPEPRPNYREESRPNYREEPRGNYRDEPRQNYREEESRQNHREEPRSISFHSNPSKDGSSILSESNRYLEPGNRYLEPPSVSEPRHNMSVNSNIAPVQSTDNLNGNQTTTPAKSFETVQRTKIFVGRLPEQTYDNALRELFEQYGGVKVS